MTYQEVLENARKRMAPRYLGFALNVAALPARA